MEDMKKQEWEIRPCWAGTDCWCRRICTKSGTEVVDSARIRKEVASYFTALHNARLRNERGYYSRIRNIYAKKFENMDFYDDDNKLITKNLMNEKWKMTKCGVTGSCWCRIIVAVGGEWITMAGSFDKDRAKYLVKLHNRLLKEKKKW